MATRAPAAPAAPAAPGASVVERLVHLRAARDLIDRSYAEPLDLSGGAMTTDDVHGDYKALTEKGVEFVQPPAERPYGIEAVFRDNSGNWFSLTERPG